MTSCDRQVNLFGDVQVWADGQRIDDGASPRSRLLLAALALHRGRFVDRGELAYRLWPESTDGQARTNLRKVLHELRSWLPDDSWLEVTQRQARLRTEHVAVDVDRFLAAFERGDARSAVDVYDGPLLPGHWEDWVVDERRVLEDRVAGCFRQLLTSTADGAERTSTAQKLLRLDPTDEAAYRALMVAHMADGNRTAALRVFHTCTAVLERQLGVRPALETVGLYDSIRGATDGQSGAVPTWTPPTTLPRTSSLPLIGRARELEWLEGCWRSALTARPVIALVTGESGVGKTRLVDELSQNCERQGMVVLRSRAYESDGTGTLAPILDWLRHESVQRTLGQLQDRHRAELGRLLPELLRADEDQLSGDPAQARLRLFDAAAAALAGAGSPLLLVLDDLQWCDADTVDFVLHLLRRGPLLRAMVAMTRRSYERPVDRALDMKLADLRSEGVLADRLLGRLQPVSTAALARLASGATWSDNQVAKLHIETDGLPLFVVEAARTGPEADHLTPTVRGTIERRLGRLEPNHLALLEVAAVIGRRFDPIELATAADREEDRVLDAIDELWRLGLLVAEGSDFDFGHDLFREVVVTGTSPARRARLHRDVARSIVSLHGPDIGPVADRLAEHYEQGGLIDDAINARRAAAARAAVIGVHLQAIEHLERALALLADQPAGVARDRRELELVTDLGAAQVVHEGYGGAQTQRTWARAEALNVRLGGTLSAPVLRGLGLAAVSSCRLDQGVEYGWTLCGLSDPIAQIEGHYVLGVAWFWQGSFDQAEHHLRQAIADYDPARSRQHRSLYGQDPKPVCLSRLAHLLALRGRAVEADEHIRQAEFLARDLNDSLTAWYVWHWRVSLDRYLRRPVAGEPPEGSSYGFFATTDREVPLWDRAFAGDPGAEADLERITDSWRDTGRCVDLVKWLSVLAELRINNGDEARALKHLDEADAFAHDRGIAYLNPELGRLRARAMRQRAEPGCSEVAAAAVQSAQLMGAAGLALRARSELLRCTGDRSVADFIRSELDRLRPVHHGWDIDDAERALRETTVS